MKIKQWLVGTGIGVLIGLLTGAYFAYTDWCLNPGGIFHGEDGTNWGVVMETVTSWWWPVAGWVTVISWIVIFLVMRLRK